MKKDVLFTLPAEALEGAKKIYVLGDFNDWKSSEEYELKIQPDGSASATVALESGKVYRYRFLINDEKWVNDYHAERYERDENYQIDNCIITVTASGNTAEGKTAKKAKSRTTAANKKAAPKTAIKKKSAKSASSKTKASGTSKPRARKTSTSTGKAESREV